MAGIVQAMAVATAVAGITIKASSGMTDDMEGRIGIIPNNTHVSD